jgi:hypothetical protein
MALASAVRGSSHFLAAFALGGFKAQRFYQDRSLGAIERLIQICVRACLQAGRKAAFYNSGFSP